jgi:hypothetical protein
MDIKEEGLVDLQYSWYYQSKIIAILRLLSSNAEKDVLVDVGAGSGFFGMEISKKFHFSQTILIDPGYGDSKKTSSKKIEYYRSCPHIPASTYLFIDVLEHVDFDSEFLSHYVSESRPGAKFVISVPAFDFLWSSHDEFLQHKRRYSKKSLMQLAISSGIEIEDSYYIFSAVFPIAFLKRRFLSRKMQNKSDLRDYRPLVNNILKKICVFEHKYIKNPWFGTSVVLMGTKSNH